MRISKSLFLFFLLFITHDVLAQCRLLNENFNAPPTLSPTNVNGAWYPDRYTPAAFTNDVLNGENVLKISIDGINDGLNNRPAGYKSSFYNTQGRKFNQCGNCVTALKGSLYIPADWANHHRRSDMWATAFNSANAVSAYPIIGFRNPDATTPGIYYYDINTGQWVNSGVALIYDNWYDLEFRIIGSNLEYLVNGVIVGTLPANASKYFGDIIMQAFNFNDPTLPVANQSTDSYNAYWDNLMTTGTGGNVVTNLNTGISYCSIQAAINDAATMAGHTLQASAGTYNEDVTINKDITLQGAGMGSSIISGLIGGDVATVRISASGATIEGFTITRDGNNPADWNNANLNSAGVAIQGLATSNVTIQYNEFIGNRTGIDINNSGGHFILNNNISNNRTGLIFRNQNDGAGQKALPQR